MLHGKYSFAKVIKSLTIDTDKKIILLDHQNNYMERSSIKSNDAKSFDILATSLSVLRNYFQICLAKLLDISAKSFFSCGFLWKTCDILLHKITG